RLNTYHTDEYSNTTNEGVFSALGSALKGIATQTVAHGLGVSSGTVSKFAGNLSKPKKFRTATMVSAQKKPHHQPTMANIHHLQNASPSSIHNMVLPSHVHSAIGKYPGEHETHLNNFINSHNAGITAKEKGDKNLAAMHFKERNRAMV